MEGKGGGRGHDEKDNREGEGGIHQEEAVAAVEPGGEG